MPSADNEDDDKDDKKGDINHPKFSAFEKKKTSLGRSESGSIPLQQFTVSTSCSSSSDSAVTRPAVSERD